MAKKEEEVLAQANSDSKNNLDAFAAGSDLEETKIVEKSKDKDVQSISTDNLEDGKNFIKLLEELGKIFNFKVKYYNESHMESEEKVHSLVVIVPPNIHFYGIGITKNEAQIEAAKHALEFLKA